MEFAFSADSLSSTALGLLQWQTALMSAAVIPQQALQTDDNAASPQLFLWPGGKFF